MNPRLFAVVIAVLFLSFGRARSDDIQDAVKLLQGRWRVLSALQNGVSYPEDSVAKMFVTVTNDELRVYVEGTKSEQAAKFTIDPTKNPRHIDFTRQTRDSEWDKGLLDRKLFTSWKQGEQGAIPADHKAEGIYKLEGGKWTVCWRTTKGKELFKDGASKALTVRPSQFQSVLYYHQFLFVLEKVGAEK